MWSEAARRSLRAHARAGARTLRLPLAQLCKVLASKGEWIAGGRGGGGVCRAYAERSTRKRGGWTAIGVWALCCSSSMQMQNYDGCMDSMAMDIWRMEWMAMAKAIARCWQLCLFSVSAAIDGRDLPW